MHTSGALEQLRALIEGQLGSFSRGLVLALLGFAGTLVAILLYGLVMMRRKDLGDDVHSVPHADSSSSCC